MEDRTIRRLGRRGGATLLTIGLALGGFSVFAPTAFGAGGNNGTVKIREAGTAIEDNSNDPHIKCLESAWYGFDQNSTVVRYEVSFVNPTAGPTTTYTVGTLAALDPVHGNDAALGGNDFDAAYRPVIDTTGVAPQNGEWHVRVEIDTTLANQTINKFKTVWISNQCAAAPTPSAVLQVSKSVDGTGTDAVGGNFQFSVSCPGGTVSANTLGVAAGGSTTVTVSPVGTQCTVTETADHNADATHVSVDGGAEAASTSATVSVQGDDANPSAIAFRNTFNAPQQPPGNASATIEVHKAVTGAAAPIGASFPFTVTCTTGTVTGSPLTVSTGASSTATVSWVANGTAPSCTVTETNQHGATTTSWQIGNGGASTNGTAAATGVLTNGGTTDVFFTNDYPAAGLPVGGNNPPPVVNNTPPPAAPSTPANNPAPNVGQPQTIAPTTTVPSEVRGVQIVAPADPAPQSQVLGTELARTGAMTDRLIQLAGLCLLLGGIALVASKERTAVKAEAPTRRR